MPISHSVANSKKAMTVTLCSAVGFMTRFKWPVVKRLQNRSVKLSLTVPERLDYRMDSKSDSIPNTSLDEAGPTLIDVVWAAWRYPLALQSDYARKYDQLIAAAAYEGLITTWEGGDTYGRIWRPTPEGLKLLWETIE